MVGRRFFAPALAVLLVAPVAGADDAAPAAASTKETADPAPRAAPRGARPRAKPGARARSGASKFAVATLPGFELLADGSSRLFVQLTQPVQVEEKRAAGTLTYVLHGARVLRRNNENALVTVHFNTPVTRARVIPRGHDLHFVVELRDNVTPTWKLTPAKDGASILMIDFPAGEFLPAERGASDASPPPAGAGASAPPANAGATPSDAPAASSSSSAAPPRTPSR